MDRVAGYRLRTADDSFLFTAADRLHSGRSTLPDAIAFQGQQLDPASGRPALVPHVDHEAPFQAEVGQASPEAGEGAGIHRCAEPDLDRHDPASVHQEEVDLRAGQRPLPRADHEHGRELPEQAVEHPARDPGDVPQLVRSAGVGRRAA
jgi:hypothetical protein